MEDRDQNEKLRREIEAVRHGGMKILHQRAAGRAVLLYSETQRADNREILARGIISESQKQKAGCVVALEIESGKTVRFTDLYVLQGDENTIDLSLQPYSFVNAVCSESEKFYADWREVAKADPRNLVVLQTECGDADDIFFERPNPRSRSLVAYYGREKAIEILHMLRDLPEPLRPQGIYNGIGYTSFDEVIKLGKQPYTDQNYSDIAMGHTHLMPPPRSNYAVGKGPRWPWQRKNL